MKLFYPIPLVILFTGFSSYAQNRLPADGNVGIGTNSPTAGLTVQLEGGNTADGSLFLVNGVNNNFGGFATLAGIKTTAGDGGQYNFLKLQNAGGVKLLINGSGNVGIGTTAPQGKVEINNGSYNNDNQLILSGGEATRYYGVAGITIPAGHTVLSLGTRSNNTNHFETLNIVDENVGIGTMNPDAKLAVKGTIHSQSVLIDMKGWSDYVFKKEYQLKPLSEVKTYIDQNQHLPEIPSEQEMVKNGLDVGEMNKLLMKKVEELTLYLIEQNKRIGKLEDQLKTKK